MASIREFKRDDGEDVKELIDTIMEKEFPDQTANFPTNDLNDITSSYGDKGEAFFVACQDDSIVGTVGVKREDERTALLRRIFVKEEHRNKKIGARLMKKAIEFCRDKGYQEVVFKTTSRMEGAVRLCQKAGFVERARVNLGSVELLKFALFLKENMSISI